MLFLGGLTGLIGFRSMNVFLLIGWQKTKKCISLLIHVVEKTQAPTRHWAVMYIKIERRSVTSRYHGSKISGWQKWGAKQQTLHMQHAFLYISWLRYPTATWNFLTSRACFMECVNTTQKFCFSFSKLRCGPFVFNPRNFRQHLTNKMKFSEIDEVWNSAN